MPGRAAAAVGVAVAVLGSAVSGPAASPSSFSIEQVLSAPFPSDLVAAPAGRAVAWVFDDRGVRNLWVATGSPLRARRLTANTRADGQELSQLEWAPDGSAVVYVRGGDKSEKGEVPNPTSEPTGIDQEVWIVRLDGAPPRKLGAGHSPALSPKGDRIAFVFDDQVWAAPASGGDAKKLFTVRGKAGSLQWSPDGAALAFVTNRENHNFVGVFRGDQSAIEYVAPSLDRDELPRWSPDGRRLAFVRVRTVETGALSSLNPWSVMVAALDGTTSRFGPAREVWRSPEVAGGSYARTVRVLEWLEGDRLLFSSEHEKWAHLYAVGSGASRGAATLLTPGECEVEHVVLAEDRRDVFFSSNCGEIDGRHVWRVSGAAPPQQVTRGAIEFSPAVTADGGTLVFLRSDARRPGAPYAVALAGSSAPAPLVADALPRDFPTEQLVEPKTVVFKSSDGWEIHGQLFEPGTPGSGRRPALVFMHGGPPRQMLPGWHYMYYYSNAYGMNQYLASRGFMVLSVNYRLGIGYGRAFREVADGGARGGAEYKDVLAAAEYLRQRPDVDPQRIGLWGGSYGGYLTAMGLARNSDVFKAGVDFHGVHDWSVFRRFNLGPAATPEATRVARESSPIASVDKWRSPVLFIHGDDDRNVDFSQTVDLARALRKRGVEFEELVFPDEVHDFLLHSNWVRAYEAAADFLDRHLMNDR
ncbi:MAG TPA: prolyl oligopeptidase family serine peptidase [Vicinamibacteria bacterium]